MTHVLGKENKMRENIDRKGNYKQYNKAFEKKHDVDTSNETEVVKEASREEVKPTRDSYIFNGTAMVTADILALRKEPNGNIITTLSKGDTVTVDDSYDGGEWVKIVLPEEGYVMAKYLYKDK